MLLVDPREGSGVLQAPLRRMGLEVEAVELSVADVAWVGRGPEESAVPVGVEFKKLQEILDCMVSGRFTTQQLPGLREEYGQDAWLLIEGRYETGSDGVMYLQRGREDWVPVSRKGRWVKTEEVMGWMWTHVYRAGVQAWWTGRREETLQWLAGHYRWWTGKAWEEHKSAQGWYEGAPGRRPTRGPGRTRSGKLLELFSTRQGEDRTLVRRMVKELPGIGWEASAALARAYPQALALTVGVEEIAEVRVGGEGKGKGKRIGRKVAERVVRAMGNGADGA